MWREELQAELHAEREELQEHRTQSMSVDLDHNQLHVVARFTDWLEGRFPAEHMLHVNLNGLQVGLPSYFFP